MTTETIQSLFIIALTVTVVYQWYVIKQHTKAWRRSTGIFVKLYHFLERYRKNEKDIIKFMNNSNIVDQNLHDRLSLLEIRMENVDD